jgi:glycosyltransferase involved in cell wall biosynthesis
MMTNRNMICLSSTEWGGDYIKASVELMKELATQNNILFVNSPYTVKDLFDGLCGKRNIEIARSFGFKDRVEKLKLPNGGSVYLFTPPPFVSINFLPEGFIYQTLLKFNGWQLRYTAAKALKKLGMTDRLINFVAFNQGMGVTTGRRFGEQTLVYHCYDEIRGAHPWLKKHGIALEERFLKMVDGTIVTSKGLYEAKKDLCKACYIVKNAVNIDLFSQGFQSEVKPEKVVGYIGSIDERLDYDLLVHLLENMPDTKFVFVGRVTTDFGEEAVLRKYPNAELTGAKLPEELPGYLKTFSAGIIPFVKSDFTRGIYPMKINEYLAAGLPVISTDFSNLDDFEGIINITGDKEAFLRDLQTELAADTPEKRNARLEVAKQNTWTVRAGELSAAIGDMEANK